MRRADVTSGIAHSSMLKMTVGLRRTAASFTEERLRSDTGTRDVPGMFSKSVSTRSVKNVDDVRCAFITRCGCCYYRLAASGLFKR